MVTVGLGLGPVFSRRTETKTGQRLFVIFQPDPDPDRRSGTPLPCLYELLFGFFDLLLGFFFKFWSRYDREPNQEFFR